MKSADVTVRKGKGKCAECEAAVFLPSLLENKCLGIL